jgi:hypothetical protein
MEHIRAFTNNMLLLTIKLHIKSKYIGLRWVYKDLSLIRISVSQVERGIY